MDLLQTIHGKLGAMRRRLLMIFLSWGGAILLTTLVSLLILSFVFDTFLHMPMGLRLGLNIAATLVLIFIAMRYIVYPLTRKPSEEELALLVEREFPMLNDRLISSLQMSKERARYGKYASTDLVDASIEDGLEVAARLNFLEALRTKSVVIMTLVALGLIGVFASMIYAAPETAEIWRNRLFLGNDEYPSKYAVALSVATPEARRVNVHGRAGMQEFEVNYADWVDEELSVAIGSPLIVYASVREVGVDGVPDPEDIPQPTALIYNEISGSTEEADMLEVYDDSNERAAGRFYFVIKSVSRGLKKIEIEAGDGISEPLLLNPVDEPSVKGVEVVVDLPEYIPEEHQIRDNSHLAPGFHATAHTNVTIRCDVDAEMADGYPKIWFKDSEGQKLINPDHTGVSGLSSMSAEGDGYSGTFDIRQNYAAYEIVLKTVDGIINRERVSHRIEIIKDSTAQVALFSHGPGLRSPYEIPVTYNANIPLVYMMRDDIGVEGRKLLFVPPKKGEAGLSKQWIPLTRFSNSYESRKAALDKILEIGAKGNSSLTQGEWQQLDESIARVIEINSSEIKPTIWSTGSSHSAGLEAFGAYEKFKATSRDISGKRFGPFITAAKKLAAISGNASVDTYQLRIESLMRASEYPNRESIEDAYIQRSNQPLKMRMRLAAVDANPKNKNAFTQSDEVIFHVGPRSFVTNEISTQVSNNIYRPLSSLRRDQAALKDELTDIIDAHPTPEALTPKELEVIRSIGDRTSYLRRDFESIIKRLDLIAQTYNVNDLSVVRFENGTSAVDNNILSQEKSISKVRLLIGMIMTPNDKAYAVDEIRDAIVDLDSFDLSFEESEGYLSALEEAYGFLGYDRSLGRTLKLQEIASFFDASKQDAGGYRRLLDAFDTFSELDQSESLSAVYEQLDELKYLQQKLLDGIAEIDSLLKKWKDFDRIREEWEALARIQREIEKDIKEGLLPK